MFKAIFFRNLFFLTRVLIKKPILPVLSGLEEMTIGNVGLSNRNPGPLAFSRLVIESAKIA